MKGNRCFAVVAMALLIVSCWSGYAHAVVSSEDQSEANGFDLATQRLVLTTYIDTWANPNASAYWARWNWDACNVSHDPNSVRPDGKRDIASVYYPLIGPYDSGDDSVIEYHMRLAQASGIDVFVVDWYGTKNFYDFPQQNRKFMNMMRIAERMNFGIAVDYDVTKFYVGEPGQSISKVLIPNRSEALQAIHDDLAYVIQKFGGSPSYLKFDGKPVIFAFSNYDLEPRNWGDIFESLRKQGLDAFYVDMQGNTNYYPYFRGFFPWIWADAIAKGQIDSVSYINKAARRLAEFAQGRSISWGLAVWPGFDDSAVGGWCYDRGVLKIGRMSGTLYNQTWKTALRSAPDWIFIITFNDWSEGTIIEPSLEFGYQYLYATAYFAGQLKKQQPNLDAVLIGFAIYDGTQAIGEAEKQSRTVGLDDARGKLEQAMSAFDSRQYSVALALVSEAKQLAVQAKAPPITETSARNTSSATSTGTIQTPFSANAWLLPTTGVLIAVLVVTILWSRRNRAASRR